VGRVWFRICNQHLFTSKEEKARAILLPPAIG